MKQKILLVTALSLASISSQSFAGFNFCPENSQNKGGSNSFQQKIPLSGVVEVGELPIGISEVKIDLKSTVDIDIQLFDKITGEKIIHWPNGILAGSQLQQTEYHDTLIEWSGYNGDGTGVGNEFIKLSGTETPSTPTTRAYTMKVFGYKAGLADVNYSWKGANCDIQASGKGSFKQDVVKDSVVVVGDIPKNISNIKIDLNSQEDVDIQLYDTDTGAAIVAWPKGLLKGSDLQTINHQGMVIEWSGYNGDGTNPGKEYIKISGKTTRNLTMKAFGYHSGFATVNYTWGKNTSDNKEVQNTDNESNTETQNQSSGNGSSAEAQMKAQFLGLVNQARSQGRNCGGTYYPATTSVSWNGQLYQAALGHSKDMANKNFFSHTSSNGNNAGTRITNAGYTWVAYAENIAAGQPTAQAVMDGWLKSPGHCKNIMSTAVTNVGVAKVTGNGTYGVYWTQNFAKHK